MTRRQRQDYTYLGEFKPPGQPEFKVRVLADFEAILKVQAPLAAASRYGHNKQVYGPFRVIVATEKPPKKQKRKKKPVCKPKPKTL